VAFHRKLLTMRRKERLVDGAMLREAIFVLRFESRLLIVNLGDDVDLEPVNEPLLAGDWMPAWSSGAPMTRLWEIPGHAAIVFASATPAAPDR